MEFKEILAISGQPGLFKYVARSTNGVIVESLADHRRTNASGTAKISSLAEIAIFTDGEDLPLNKVFESMFAVTEGKQGPDHKSDAKVLREFFAKAVPDYDRERVHSSDIKKAVAWFNMLVAEGMTDFTIEKADKEEQQTEGEQE